MIFFGNEAGAALVKEATQTGALETFKPQKVSDLTYQQKRMALAAMMLISQKSPNSKR